MDSHSHFPTAGRINLAHGRLGGRARKLFWVVTIVVIAGGGVLGGLHRALSLQPDWSSFHRESRYVWEHERTASDTAMFGYLPIVPVLLWPFTVWPSNELGASLWVGLNTLCAVAALIVVRKWWLSENGPIDGFLWAMLLCCINLAHAIQANQMTLITMILIVAGAALVERRRSFLGGAVLGAAVVIKVMPAILFVYLLLRRRWRAAIGMVVGVIVLDCIPSVMVFGLHGAAREHADWFRRVRWHSNSVWIEDPLLRAHLPSAAYSAVLARWFRATPRVDTQVILKGSLPPDVVEAARAGLGPLEVLSLDPIPPRDAPWAMRRVDISYLPEFRLADLSATPIKVFWAGTLALGFAFLVVATLRTPNIRHTDVWAPIAALWLLAMFWPSPMMRHYYLTWAFPAVALVCQALVRELRRMDGRWTLGMRVGAFGIWSWVLGLACLGLKLPRWYGVHLFVIAALMVATAWVWRLAVLRMSEPDWGVRNVDGPKHAEQ